VFVEQPKAVYRPFPYASTSGYTVSWEQFIAANVDKTKVT